MEIFLEFSDNLGQERKHNSIREILERNVKDFKIAVYTKIMLMTHQHNILISFNLNFVINKFKFKKI